MASTIPSTNHENDTSTSNELLCFACYTTEEGTAGAKMSCFAEQVYTCNLYLKIPSPLLILDAVGYLHSIKYVHLPIYCTKWPLLIRMQVSTYIGIHAVDKQSQGGVSSRCNTVCA